MTASEMTMTEGYSLIRNIMSNEAGDDQIQINHPKAKTEATTPLNDSNGSMMDWSPPANSPYSVTYKRQEGNVVIQQKDWMQITKSMTKQQALGVARQGSAILSLCLFAVFVTITLGLQALYICWVHKAHHHQEQLEKHILGDECDESEISDHQSQST